LACEANVGHDVRRAKVLDHQLGRLDVVAGNDRSSIALQTCSQRFGNDEVVVDEKNKLRLA
jgi:hypothetical protein